MKSDLPPIRARLASLTRCYISILKSLTTLELENRIKEACMTMAVAMTDSNVAKAGILLQVWAHPITQDCSMSLCRCNGNSDIGATLSCILLPEHLLVRAAAPATSVSRRAYAARGVAVHPGSFMLSVGSHLVRASRSQYPRFDIVCRLAEIALLLHMSTLGHLLGALTLHSFTGARDSRRKRRSENLHIKHVS